jgi:hypothetical protein
MASLATYDAVLDATRGHPQNGRASAPAAAAVAAHDVLENYFAASATMLDQALTDDLEAIPDSPAKDRGAAIGHVAAAAMIASRANAGHDPNPVVAYTKPATVGIWRPTPPALLPMAVPWLGFVTPLLLSSPTEIHPNGPDALTSVDYFNDYEEVRTAGSATGSTRTADQTDTARFFNHNAVSQYERGLIDLYTRHPDDIVATARTFAMVNASVADALITTWRLKYDVGYWRPITAIREGDADTNPSTVGDPTWTPLIDDPSASPPGAQVGTPPYPEYPSGHASITNAFTESLARATGTRTTDLYLYSGVTDSTRHYTSLDTLSHDAFMARIWLGIHFRDAMEDAVYVGSEAARLADQRLP